MFLEETLCPRFDRMRPRNFSWPSLSFFGFLILLNEGKNNWRVVKRMKKLQTKKRCLSSSGYCSGLDLFDNGSGIEEYQKGIILKRTK